MNTSAPVKISDYISGALAVLSITPKCPQLFEDSKNGFEIKIQKENQQPNNVENGISSAVRIAQKIQEHNQKSSIIKEKHSDLRSKINSRKAKIESSLLSVNKIKGNPIKK